MVLVGAIFFANGGIVLLTNWNPPLGATASFGAVVVDALLNENPPVLGIDSFDGTCNVEAGFDVAPNENPPVNPGLAILILPNGLAAPIVLEAILGLDWEILK